MNSQYCHNCGKQLIIGSRFCSGCGTNLTSLAHTPETSRPKQARANLIRPAIKDDDDPESYLDELDHLTVNISALDVEIIKPKQIGETIGSIAMEGAQGISSNIEARPIPPSTDKKTFLEEFRKEAGTRGRNQPPTEVG